MTDDEARANDLVHQHNEYVSDHVCSLACREAAILSALAGARREAYEEAAKVCDGLANRGFVQDDYDYSIHTARAIAQLIRALATRRTTDG